MDSPRGAEQRRTQANPWGRLSLVTFFGEAKKVTGPARPQSALVAPATRIRNATVTLSLALSPQGRGNQMRSWFDRLTTNGNGTHHAWWTRRWRRSCQLARPAPLPSHPQSTPATASSVQSPADHPRRGGAGCRSLDWPSPCLAVWS